LSVDWPLSAAATLWCFAALFAGYAVRGAAGFGSGIVATPLMAFVLPLATVAPLVTFLGMFVSVRQALRDWKSIAWRHLLAFVPGIAIGVPLGIWVFHAVSPALVLKLLGAYVVAYALYSLLGPKLGWGHWTMPRWAALPIGTLGAIVATLFGGMAGPVFVTWLDGQRLDKRVFRVTTSTTLFTLSITRSIAYVIGGLFAVDDLVLLAAAAVPVALGTLAGDRLHDRLDPEAFRRMVGGVLIFSGGALLLT
jgi:uncharacterized membrane protein YfcA